MPRPTYSEAEAADVLGRAARLQAASDQRRMAPGLTLDDLKEAAAAAGIAPEFVEHAARTPDADAPAPPPYAGVPMGVRRTQLVAGPLDDATWGRIVADLRGTLGGQGTVEDLGGLRSWYRAPLRVTAEPAGAFTRVTATAAWGAEVRTWIGLAIGLLVLAAGMGTAALVTGQGPFGTITAVYLVLAALSAARTWPRYRAKEARVGRKFDAALARIDAAMSAAHPTTAAPVGGTAPAPAPLLDGLATPAGSTPGPVQVAPRRTRA